MIIEFSVQVGCWNTRRVGARCINQAATRNGRKSAIEISFARCGDTCGYLPSNGLKKYRMMSEFFHGWRRKFGVVSLVLALAFMGFWVRSQATCDLIEFATNDGATAHVLSFDEKGVFWRRQHSRNGGRYAIGDFYRTTSAGILDHTHNPMGADGPDQYSCVFGLEFMYRQHEDCSISVTIIPYWRITTPLILLSVHLLLIKPRSSKSKQDSTAPARSGQIKASLSQKEGVRWILWLVLGQIQKFLASTPLD